ncbi:putative SAM-dependent methyltransferase [Desulfamplus magnetovallimortis]|uniref:Putative SAM-dependent methyltransferase n=1 Tax=Desulfamplus magnetovallimortis TaxID=1246637 RepID=A0A1W1H7C4_9BACT|nr:class I SAM-dependent methyltransferase [Desulfamplus magnetovallimortis]SLM28367.1 putative SAM-dependent methyltransferase [Desulfamplus magnetovallimortis]
MKLFPLKNQKFWKDLWHNAIDNASEEKSCTENVKRWDKRADSFAKRTSSPEAIRRKEDIFSMLFSAGALKSGSRVLDIGAGPGNWAIPMVEAGAYVTALEPSAGMVDVLKKKMAAKNISPVQIKIDQRAWQDVNVEKEDMIGHFDLVFASMSPGVRDPETLDKAMKASRGFCYLSTFSGGGWRSCYNDMWKEITGEELESSSWDFIYPFTYVYSLGYRPRVAFNVWSHDREESIEDAIQNILFFVEGATEITTEARENLADYVQSHSVDGMFRQKQTICQGVMLWQVA